MTNNTRTEKVRIFFVLRPISENRYESQETLNIQAGEKIFITDDSTKFISKIEPVSKQPAENNK